MPVEIAGKTYRPAELKDMADRVMEARKACAAQLAGLHESQGRLQRVAATLERRQHDSEGRLAAIEGQLAVIDSNRILVVTCGMNKEGFPKYEKEFHACVNSFRLTP